jgi:threonine/homoserine/homoserine lactone efflux protein
VTGSLQAFLGISVLVIVTPGQDTALTIRNAMVGGRRGGLFTAMGVSSGQLVWSIAASAGVAALLVAWKPAFLAVKYAGVAYLVFLGAQAIRDAVRGRGHHAAPRGGAAGRSPGSAYRQGVISNLGNPKMAVFFTSLLPQFGSRFVVLIVLGIAFCTMTLVWLACYAVAVAKVEGFLRRSRVRRALDALTGTVLVALGVRLAAEQS